MIIRIGLPTSFRRLGAAARALGAPVLVSANAFWRGGRFIKRDGVEGLDLAVDSAGFVAMRHYGGYRWSIPEYVAFVARIRPTWWSAPDYCCEPEIARDREAVRARIALTVDRLEVARFAAFLQNLPPPLPVLQGRDPEDYVRCAEKMAPLPRLVGVGSTCRRTRAEIIAIIQLLDRELPRHVGLHLFGVKGSAIAALAGHPRVASVDSMAWDFAARREKIRDNTRFTLDYRIGHMQRWYRAQQDGLGLFAGAA
jgi:hypothetical protein